MSQHDNPTAWWHSDKPARHILRHEDGSEVELSESDLDAMMRRWDQVVREMEAMPADNVLEQIRALVDSALKEGKCVQQLMDEVTELLRDVSSDPQTVTTEMAVRQVWLASSQTFSAAHTLSGFIVAYGCAIKSEGK